jgi:hypothetical protein
MRAKKPSTQAKLLKANNQ